MNKTLKIISLIILAVLLVVFIYTISAGRIDLKIFGFRLIFTTASALRSIALLLFAGDLFIWEGSWSSIILERVFLFPREISEKIKYALISGASVFLFAGVLLGLYDAFFDPEIINLTVFAPIIPSWNDRGIRIAYLLMYYSVPSFIIGFIVSSISFLSVKREKITSFIFFGAFLLFAILFKTISLINLEPFGPINITDALLYVFLSFLIMVLMPRHIISDNYIKSASSLLLTVLLMSGYFGAGYFENKNRTADASRKHTRILLITMDTARADHFSVKGYDYGKDTTPGLKAIASEGAVLNRTYSEVSTTEPSHTSILTGTYPRTHGLLKNGDKITNQNLNFLQTLFKKQGFATGAVTSRTLFAAEELGWPVFDFESYPKTKKHRAQRRETFVAEYAFRRAKEWIDNNYDRDFFLFVHFWDPHWPYMPPAPERSEFNAGFKGYELRPSKRSFIKEKNKYSPDEIDYMVSMYDGEIAYTEKYVTKLVRYLEKKIPSSSDAPIIIITADHGDVMGEVQDRFGFVFDHGETLNFGETYVPLIIKWKGHINENSVYDDIVESIDIAPTLLDLLGQEGRVKFDGRSFASLLRGEEYTPKEALFAQKRPYAGHPVAFVNAPEYAVTTKKWRLIVNEVRGNELYDAVNDRLEEKNAADDNPEIVNELLAKLEEWKEKHPPAKEYEGEMSKKKTDVLKSLGYIQ